MALITKITKVEAKIGDEVAAPNTVFRSDLTLYICHIDGDLLYINTEKDSTKSECEVSFAEDCYLTK